MDHLRYAALFLSETREHLSSINHLLLRLESEGDLGVVEAVFRSAHTLKGMAGAMACPVTAELAHALESVLDPLREGSRAPGPEVTDVLFETADALERAAAMEVRGEGAELEYGPLVGRLQAVAARLSGPGPTGAPPVWAEGVEPAPAVGRGLRVTVVLQAATPLPAVRAMLILRRAAELGEVTQVTPSEEELLAGRFSGSVSFLLSGELEAEAVRATLLAAGDVAHVGVEGPAGEEDAEDAEDGPRSRTTPVAGGSPLVRISQERLDTLVNQVGELVVARDRLRQLAAARTDEALEEAAEDLSRLVGELRDEVMSLRMVPVREAFERFPRFVRDTARTLGKRVEFTTRGQDVEVDRSLLNELGDLLVHLLRNALDHGVETPAERRALGKPEVGRVSLVATRERERLVVEVSDDGRGIDFDRVLELAVARELVTRDEADGLSREAVLELLSRPGFSTAQQVTEVSGRGVGLDAVSTRASALGGKLDVETQRGEGTAFVLRLPLSLAIVRSLLVEVDEAIYAVPISSVVEVTELEDAPGQRAEESLELRGETVPLLCLRSLLAPDAPPLWQRHTPVVVLDAGATLLAVRVDALRGQHEGVLKPFDAVSQMTRVFNGATLLADGRPALLLDAARLAARAPRKLALDGA